MPSNPVPEPLCWPEWLAEVRPQFRAKCEAITATSITELRASSSPRGGRPAPVAGEAPQAPQVPAIALDFPG